MKFNMSAAWHEAIAMIAANREVLLVVAGIFFFLPSLLLGLIMPDLSDLMGANGEFAEASVMAAYNQNAWLIFLVLLASMVGYLSLLALLRDHARPTVGQALSAGLRSLLPAIGTYLLATVAAVAVVLTLALLVRATGSAALGAVVVLACVIGLIYLGVKFSLAAPVIAIDKVRNPIAVLARSWRLTHGNTLRLVLFFVLIGIVYIVLSIVAGIVMAALMLVLGETAFELINALLSGLISAALAVIVVAVLAAVHRQLSGASPERLGETFE